MEIEFESGSKKNSDRTWLNIYLLLKNKKKKIKPVQEICNTANQRKQIYELMTGKKYSFIKTIIRKGKCLKGKIKVVITNSEVKVLEEKGFPLKFTIVSH